MKDTVKARYRYANSHFENINGCEIHYRKTGSGPCLLLLHGLNSSLITWEGWHEKLAGDFTVLSIDLPGFGLSGGAPKGQYNIQFYMRTLDTLLAKLSIQQCSVIGHSFGGLIAWQYALHARKNVERLILMNATGYPRKRLPINYRLLLKTYLNPVTHNFTPRFIVKKALHKVYGDKQNVDSKTVRRYYDIYTYRNNRREFSRILKAFFNPIADYQPKIRHIKQPTLVIWGKKDRIIPLDHAHRFINDIDNSKLITYSNIGHVPMEEAVQQSIYDVVNFLAS